MISWLDQNIWGTITIELDESSEAEPFCINWKIHLFTLHLTKIMYVFYLSCPNATFALQRGGFVPREWLAAKGLFRCRGFGPPGTLVT